jgi:hypothetical protein
MKLKSRIRISLSLGVLCFVALLLFAAPTYGQEEWGAITGTITDASAAPVPGATVIVTGHNTTLSRTVDTNTVGLYTVSPLRPGSYDISVSKPGFKTIRQSEIALSIQSTIRLDFVLQIGEVRETIEVTAAAPMVESQTSSVGTLFNERAVGNLPLNGRNFVQLALLTPGTTEGQSGNVNGGARADNRRASGSLAAAGMQFNWNNYTLDGINNTEGNQNNVVVLPNIEAIQEFKVLTGIYPAEYGRNSGAQVVVITKAGTNQVHGSLYEFLRNSRLDARNFFDPNGPTPAYRQNQFGGTLGGPVVIPKVHQGKDKTWFFADFEGLRVVQALTVINSVPPTSIKAALESHSDVAFDPQFFGSTPIKNPLTGLPFPNNTIPYSMIDPVAAKLVRSYPNPTGGVTGANFLWNPGLVSNRAQFDARIDHKFSDRDTLFGRFSFGNAFIDYPYGLPTATVDSVTFANLGATSAVFPGPQDANSRGLSLTETHILSSNKVNVFRFGFSRWMLNDLTANSERGDVAARLGIPGVNEPGNLIYAGLPMFAIPGFSPLGDPIAIPLPYAANTFEWSDALSIVHGSHTIKVGGEFRKMQMNIGQVLYPRGYYIMTGAFTGNGLADFLFGRAQVIARSYYDTVPGVRNFGMSFFAQDDWRATNKLTFNLGLRWEVYSPNTDSHDRLTNFDITAGSPLFAGKNASKTGDVHMDTNNFGPRFGYAYQITPKLVSRGGFGVLYNLPLAVGFWYSGVYNVPNFYNLINVYSYASAPTFSQGFVPPSRPFPASGPGFSYFVRPSHPATTYVLEWTQELQYEIKPNLLWRIGYLGNGGRKIYRAVNLNMPLPAYGPLANVPLNDRRRWPALGNVNNLQNDAVSSYNALLTSLEKRFSNGLNFLVAYTWAHGIDDVCIISGSGNCVGAGGNIWNFRYDRGNSTDTDQQHRLSVSYQYELPFGPGKPFLSNVSGLRRHLVQGWSVGGITLVSSGLPFGVVTTAPTVGNGVAPRPDVNPNLSGCPAWRQTINSWFDPCSFVQPAAGVYGNVGRNTLFNPARNNWDVSIFKQFVIKEQTRLEFRAECFNIANHANFQGPPGNTVSGNPTSPLPTQGKIYAAYPSRQIQFALKLLF